jgi:pimeloyl-ACP methyl ester carboxylesterase
VHGQPVVLVHGALRSRVGLLPTAHWLRRRGLAAWTFGYPTRRGDLQAHGDALARALDARLAGERVPVLGFLTHSMGGLVVRAYLMRHAGQHAERHRVVMLSPPNRGAELAERNRGNPLMRWLYGDAAEELRPQRAQRLPGPPAGTDVLVLAGARGDPRGYNRFISAGDDDGVVAVAEMGLPGVEPTVVGGLHAFLQWRPAVLERAVAFLREEGGA